MPDFSSPTEAGIFGGMAIWEEISALESNVQYPTGISLATEDVPAVGDETFCSLTHGQRRNF